MFKAYSSRLLSTYRPLLQKAAAEATKTEAKSSCAVGTNLNLGIKKGKAGPVALEDSEYPPWLWIVLDGHKKLGKEAQSKLTADESLDLRRKNLRKENRSKIKQNNFISQL